MSQPNGGVYSKQCYRFMRVGFDAFNNQRADATHFTIRCGHRQKFNTGNPWVTTLQVFV